jgi:hypothetical protein
MKAVDYVFIWNIAFMLFNIFMVYNNEEWQILHIICFTIHFISAAMVLFVKLRD